MLVATKSLEMKQTFFNLISSHQFTRMDHQDPFTHISTFYELVGSMGFEERDMESFYLHLILLSLAGKETNWLKSYSNHNLNSWNEAEEKLLRFFSLPRFIKDKYDISTFRQGPDEPLYES